jgi:hypothetical protein
LLAEATIEDLNRRRKLLSEELDTMQAAMHEQKRRLETSKEDGEPVIGHNNLFSGLCSFKLMAEFTHRAAQAAI